MVFQGVAKKPTALLLAQLAVLLLSTTVVFIEAGEQAVLERFGKPVAGGVLEPGAHFKLPWPADKLYRYHTEQIQSFSVGYTMDAEDDRQRTILWTVPHAKEQNFLVGNRVLASVADGNADPNDTLKAPPVSLITVSIPVQFQITDVLAWAYNNAEPTNLLQSLATRAVVHYLAGVDLNDVMSQERATAAETLRTQIQSAVDEHKLGAKIIFVGLQDIHPPTTVAGDYEKVVGAEQTKLRRSLAHKLTPSATSPWLARVPSRPRIPLRLRGNASKSRLWRARRCSRTRFLRSPPPRRFTSSARISRTSPLRRRRLAQICPARHEHVGRDDLQPGRQDPRRPFESGSPPRVIVMKRNILTLAVAAVLIVIFVLLLFVFQVRQSEVAVVTTFGKPTSMAEPARI